MKHLFTIYALMIFVATSFAQPATFDLRDYEGENYVTSVKNQQGGTCWTHGTMAAIEGNLLMSGNWAEAGEVGEPDLAEYHLDWWNGYNQEFNEDLDPPTGDGLEVHNGGDYRVSTAYLSRGEGAVRDIDGQSFNSPPERDNDSFHRYYPRTVEWYNIGENMENIDLIKTQIMDFGVLAICMCYSNSYISNYIHYQPPSSEELPNHSISVIGWDDNKSTQAPEDGAWLVKNSWGTSWGNGGYFWISYYDKWACREPDMGSVSFQEVEFYNYDVVYYHDYHGWRDTKPECTEAFNAFIAESGDMLTSVSFFNEVDNVDYSVIVYDDFIGGELQNELTSISGHIDYRGFHTFDLDSPIELEQGDDFYIYLYLSDGGMPYDRTSDVPVLLGGGTKTIVTSTASTEESYFMDDGTWIDFYDYDDPSGFQHTGNFCIKGLAMTAHGMKLGNVEISDPTGNNNGRIDPGETVDVLVELINVGLFDATEVLAEYTTSDAYVTINSGFLDYGDIPEGETGSASFTITVDADTPIGYGIDGGFSVEGNSNSSGFNYDFEMNFLVGRIVEDFETGDFNQFEWETSGDNDWSVVNSEVYEGSFSAKSGEIGNSSSTNLEINLDVLQDGAISFFRKVSSEPTYDFLRFYVDGSMMAEWSGEIDWSEVSYNVTAGNHTFKWSYEKDSGVQNGSDCGWIDYVVFPSIDLVNTGINNIENEMAVQTFPNPSNGIFSISYGASSGQVEISITNMLSERVYESQNYGDNGGQINIDLSDVPKGVYLLKVKDGTNELVKKLIIQ